MTGILAPARELVDYMRANHVDDPCCAAIDNLAAVGIGGMEVLITPETTIHTPDGRELRPYADLAARHLAWLVIEAQ